MSKFGNFYASKILSLKLTDLTSGFRCYKRRVLEAINLDRIYSNGYAFQIEMAYLAIKAGFKVGEMPITFYERGRGSSKMSKKIVREAVILPWRLRMRETGDLLGKIFLKKKYVKEISH
jgi:dolichol-phosphate mannosyltransferase